MTSTAAKPTAKLAAAPANTDSYSWIAPWGGSWSAAANWTDTTAGNAGTPATSAPGAGNAVTIVGTSTYTNINGSGAAAQLTISNGVLFLGTLAVGGAVTLANSTATSFELDAGASLTAGSLNIGGGFFGVGGSSLTASGTAWLASGGFLVATAGSKVQLGGLIANNAYYGHGAVAVDDNSSIEIGTAGGAAAGAVTIDKGVSAAVSGEIDGNLVVNGTLGVQGGGHLSIDEYDPYGTATAISGNGTLVLSENSSLSLGVADSAAIQFSGPAGELVLYALQTGTISGFVAGDSINVSGLATGLTYAIGTTSTTLTLTEGGKAAGTLTLAGNYTGSLFHLGLSNNGAVITVRTIGSPPTVPGTITGTAGADALYATANGQTLTGLGGGDTLSGAAPNSYGTTGTVFTGLDFKDTGAGLSGDQILNFDASDVIDLTDLSPATAAVTLANTPGTATVAVTVTDGSHTASFQVTPDAALGKQRGYLAPAADGAGGTKLSFVAVNSDAYAFRTPGGGGYSLLANWQDTTAARTATALPSYGNDVTIAGGTTGAKITGNGVAASLTTSGTVQLSGTITLGSKVTGVSGNLAVNGPLGLTGGASLTLAGSVGISAGSLSLSGGSKLAGGGIGFSNFLLAGAPYNLLVTGGSAARFASVNTSSSYYSSYGVANIAVGATSSVEIGTAGAATKGALTINSGVANIAVDATSSVEIGTAGTATKGALTIDSGVTANLAGTIAGNLVVNGTLDLAGNLAIAAYGTIAPSITGSGTIVVSTATGETLTLGGTDSAAILLSQSGTLALTGSLPTGTISGFSPGDAISLIQTVTRVSYSQTTPGAGTLTLFNGGAKLGTLALAGDYTANLFNIATGGDGASVITTAPAVLTGSPGSAYLYASINNQTLTAGSSGYRLYGGVYGGIDFKDSSANLNGSAIYNFVTSDAIDDTNLNPATASASYTPGSGGYYGSPGTLTLTDGTYTVTITLSADSPLPAGYFSTGADGGGGTKVTYVTVNTDAYAFTATAPSGGLYSTSSNWQDTTTGTTAPAAPGYGNAVTIAGGTTAYTNVAGNGVAASLTTSGDILLRGSLTVGATVTGVSGALTQNGSLALDGGASLVLAGTAQIGGGVQLGGGSRLTAAGLALTAHGASLLAIGGSSAQFANVPGPQYAAGATTIGVDATSSIEAGTAGGVATGALTIDSGVTANVGGTIDANLVVNGVLALAGNLTIAPFGGGAGSVTGSGTIDITSFDTLTLAGPDSAAIAFLSSYYTTTLALTGGLPSGTISGFTQGDVITVAQAVTGLSYSQTSSAGGTLTLLNGGTALGTLSLAGSYTASRFQVQVSATGQTSTITYSPAPATVSGSPVSSNSDSYNWNNAAGGFWSGAANWIDQATYTNATAAPGIGNAVTIANYYSGSPTTQVISGPGAAASLLVQANTVFTGHLTVAGQFSVGATVALAGGAVITAGSLYDVGQLQVGGGSNLTVSGLSSSTQIGGSLTVVGGSKVVSQGGSASINGSIAVDGTSSFEFGTAGGVAKGTLAIDAGQTVNAYNGGAIAANLAVNGVLSLGSGTTTIEGFGGASGAVTGSGTIQISGDYYNTALVLNAADSAAIAFQHGYANSADLVLAGPLPTGTISGFAAGDTIQVNSPVTGVSFNQTSTTQGTLTLTDGAATIGTLTLAGSYGANLFHVDVAAATGAATISLQTATSATVSGTVSTGTDPFTWYGTSGGSWSNAANWQDTSTYASGGPGSQDPVTIGGTTTAGRYTTIGGNGAAASLTTTGNVLLTGTVAIGQKLTLGSAGTYFANALALDAGAKLTAGSAAITGILTVGGGSSAVVSGTTTLSGGTLLALDGSKVKLAGVIGNNSNNVIAVDGNSIVALGNITGSVAGAVTETAGVYSVLTGAIYGSAVINGTLAVAGGGSLFIDLTGTTANDPYGSAPTISGTGLLWLAEGSTLGLGAVDSAAISFAGPNATLQLAALPTATISGFAVGDVIQIDRTVTGLTYKQVTASSATLTLSNGAATVGTLKLAGNFRAGSLAFHLDAAANGATATISLQSIGVAPTQPTLIKGTGGADLLTATANSQTITGNGGGDTLNGGGFTGIDFKDTIANLNGSTIQNFLTSDLLDFSDLTPDTATVGYTGGVLSVSDGTHAATLSLGFAGGTPATGSFHLGSDGAAGVKLTWS